MNSYPSSKDVPSYPVYVAGGGARSEWYADLFKRTRIDFSHHQVGIGEGDVKVVPAPDGMADDEYPRFVVAIGLTSDRVLFDLYRLPSKSNVRPPPEEWVPAIKAPTSKEDV